MEKKVQRWGVEMKLGGQYGHSKIEAVGEKKRRGPNKGKTERVGRQSLMKRDGPVMEQQKRQRQGKFQNMNLM